jgi:hypothetical protein
MNPEKFALVVGIVVFGAGSLSLALLVDALCQTLPQLSAGGARIRPVVLKGEGRASGWGGFRTYQTARRRDRADLRRRGPENVSRLTIGSPRTVASQTAR